MTYQTRAWNFSTFNRTNTNWEQTGVLTNFISGNITNTYNTGTISNVIMNKIDAGIISSDTPTGGSNTIINNPYSLYVDSGNSYFGESIIQPGNSISLGNNAGFTGI
jgi:hypothetical protein